MRSNNDEKRQQTRLQTAAVVKSLTAVGRHNKLNVNILE